MMKVGLIGGGIDKTLFRQHPVRLGEFTYIDEKGTQKIVLQAAQFNTWIQESIEPNDQGGTNDSTNVISILLQSMTSYHDVEFNIALLPTFMPGASMNALTTALQWMAEVVKPDFVHVGFSSQEGKYQKVQNEWVQELNRQGCKIICPAGVPPAFPALLDHVVSVADRGFIEAGFAFSNPGVIVEDKTVSLYISGAWVKQRISNETASALVLGKMIRERIPGSLPGNPGNPVILPGLDRLTLPTTDLPSSDPKFPRYPKHTFWQKARWYFKSMLSRVIIPTGKVPASIKATRKASCNGDGNTLKPCPFRVESRKYPRSFVCGACGCGDRRDVLVDGDVPKFEKLDYPFIHCPASMPGFSNYLPSKEEWNPGERKIAIEVKFGENALDQERHLQKKLSERLQKRLGWLEKI